eukprot:scaffold233583_cov28-Tisochrysis_lutea.AAC.3
MTGALLRRRWQRPAARSASDRQAAAGRSGLGRRPLAMRRGARCRSGRAAQTAADHARRAKRTISAPIRARSPVHGVRRAHVRVGRKCGGHGPHGVPTP